jgi:hypothetical protein
MNLSGSKRIKILLARESLIILGLAVILYILVTFFLQNVTIVLPKYRLEFANGEAHAINIFPEINNNYNYRRLLEIAYNPPPKLIDKRIKEFIKAENIKSALKSYSLINSKQVYISRLYSRLLGVTFLLKLLLIYLVLSLIRFIIWALRILVNPSLQR